MSLNIRVLVEWHLVRRKPIPGSRKDHYEAATDFFRAMQEIFERRFRWTVRQVLAAVDATRAEVGAGRSAGAEAKRREAEVRARLDRLAAFFSLMDAGIGAFVQGAAVPGRQAPHRRGSARAALTPQVRPRPVRSSRSSRNRRAKSARW